MYAEKARHRGPFAFAANFIATNKKGAER